MDELKNKSRHSSPTPRAFPILICGLCGSLLLYLSLSHKVLLPLDFLGWYYPFRAHHIFAGNNTFIANLWYQDVTFYFHPFAVVIGKMVESGNLPFWNPLIGVGLPMGPTHGGGAFSPIHWLSFALFRPVAAVHFELILQCLVAALSSYLLFFRWTGSSRGASLAALSWTFGGWHAAYFEEAGPAWPLALFPLIFLGIDDIEAGRRRGYFLAPGAVALTVLSGHLQMVFMSGFLVALSLLVRKHRRRGRVFWALAGGLMLGAPFLFTLQELVSLTNRPPSNFETLKNGLLAPREFLGLLLVNFMGAPSDGFYLGRSLSAPILNGREHCLYLGQASLLAGFLAIVRFRDRSSRIVLGLVCVGLVLSGAPALYGLLTTLCPPLLYVTPTRYLPYVLFGICYLAARGWKSYEERTLNARERSFIALFIGIFLAGAATFVWPATLRSPSLAQWVLQLVQSQGLSKPPYFEGSFGPVILERIFAHFSLTSWSVLWPLLLMISGILILSLAPNSKTRFAGVTLLLMLDLGSFFITMNTPMPQAMYYPPLSEIQELGEGTTFQFDGSVMPTRVLGQGRGLHPNTLMPYGICTVEAYESLMPAIFRDVFTGINDGEGLGHFIATTTDDKGLHPGLLDILGVSHLYNHPDLEARERHQNLVIETRSTALRAFLSSSWEQTSDKTRIFDPDFDPRSAVLLEVSPSFSSSPELFQEINSSYYGVNTASFDVETTRPCLLVLTDLYYPGWEVRINDQPAELLQAYGFVRAVELPAGSSRVDFIFQPTNLPLILIVTLLGLFLILGLAWTERGVIAQEAS